MKRNSGANSIFGAGLTALFFFILQGVAFAGMAVSPLQQWVEVKPGRTTTFSLIVSNTDRGAETVACNVIVDLLDFEVSPAGKLLFGPEYKHPRSALDWISFDENEFVLKPGESRDLNLKVSAPVNADGDYWVAAMVRLGNDKGEQKGVNIKLQTASGIFIHVARRNYIERATVIDGDVEIPDLSSVGDVSAEEASGDAVEEKAKVLKVRAELKNDGLIGFLARGKAYLYSDGFRRIATIPLHSSRRRVLPDDSRWFTGIMDQPLPAGDYKLRIFFASDSKYRRTMTRDMEFSVSDENAVAWMSDFVNNDSSETLGIEPQNIALQLNPGRLTAARFQVTNQTLGTILTNCRVEGEDASADWVEIKIGDFTLAPNGSRSTTCVVKVPADAAAGVYNWTIHVETERPLVSGQGDDNIERYKIPLRIVVDDTSHLVANNPN